MWKGHVPALIKKDIIKSPFLHQCRLHSNDKGFIQFSSNLQEANHLGFSCQQYRCECSLHKDSKERREDRFKVTKDKKVKKNTRTTQSVT